VIVGVCRWCCTLDSSRIADLLLFAMSRIDFAGEFRARGIKNNGRPQVAQQSRSGPGVQVNEHA
jgi:hypothetical protein